MLIANTYEDGATRSVSFVKNGILWTAGVVDVGQSHNFSPTKHIEKITPTSGDLIINGIRIEKYSSLQIDRDEDLVIECEFEPVSYTCEYPFRTPSAVFLSGLGILDVDGPVHSVLMAKLGNRNLGDLVRMSGSEMLASTGGDLAIAAAIVAALDGMGLRPGMALVEMFYWTPPKK